MLENPSNKGDSAVSFPASRGSRGRLFEQELPLRRLYIFASVLACLSLMAGLLLASPAHAGITQKTTAHRELEDPLIRVDTSRVVQSPSNEQTALKISKDLLESADPARHLAGLTDDERAIHKAYATVARTESQISFTPLDDAAKLSAAKGMMPTSSYQASAVGCWVGTGYRYGKNLWGAHLWRVQLNGGYCSSGSYISRAWEDSSFAETYWIGWSHHGRTGGGSGIVSNQGRSWTQHKFVYGAGGWNVQEQLPCLRVLGYTNGSYGVDQGCGIY